MSEPRLAVGLAVYALRKEFGLTLDELSKQSGIHTSSLSRTESGQRDLSYVEAMQIVEALNIDMGLFHELVENVQQLRPISKLRAFKQKRDRTVQLAVEVIGLIAKRRKK